MSRSLKCKAGCAALGLSRHRRQGRRVGPELLPQLHVVGREEPVPALAEPAPPAVIYHFNVGDDVIRVEGDFIIARWKMAQGGTDSGTPCPLPAARARAGDRAGPSHQLPAS